MTEVQLPEDIEFTAADRAAYNSFPKLRDGAFRGRVRYAEKGLNDKNSNLFINLTIAPLKEDGSPAKPAIKQMMVLPLANPSPDAKDEAGEPHTAPNTFWQWRNYLNTVNPAEYPLYPTRVSANVYRTVEGDTMTKAEYLDLRTKIDAAVEAEVKRRWKDPNLFIDDEFWFSVSTNDKGYPRVDNITSQEPEGVLYEDFKA